MKRLLTFVLYLSSENLLRNVCQFSDYNESGTCYVCFERFGSINNGSASRVLNKASQNFSTTNQEISSENCLFLVTKCDINCFARELQFLRVIAGECLPEVRAGRDRYSGSAVQMLEAIASSLQINLNFLKLPPNFPFFRLREDNGSLAGFLLMFSKNQADIAIGCTSLTPDRLLNADPLPLYREGTQQWSVPAPRPIFFSSFYSNFPPKIWCVVITVILLYSFVKKLSTKMDFFGLLFCVVCISLGKSVSSSSLMHRTISNCMFLLYSANILWFYESTMLMQLYITSHEDPIDSVEEAIDRGLTIWCPEKHMTMLTMSSVWGRVKNYNKFVKAENANYTLVTEDRSAILLGTPYNDMLNYLKMYPEKDLYTKVRFLKKPLARATVHFFMPKNHPLYSAVCQKMLRLFESGITFFLYGKDNLILSHFKNVKTSIALKLENLFSVFVLLVIGMTISAVVFFAERFIL